MKNYKITFGTGKGKVEVIENNCCSFAECVCRLEYTGWEITNITKIETV